MIYAYYVSLYVFIYLSIYLSIYTDTPQLEEEVKHRSPLVKELAAYSTTLKPEQIAHEVYNNMYMYV